jgi:hypothetical protein
MLAVLVRDTTVDPPRPYVWSIMVVCPDQRILRFSSNPAIHDDDQIIAVLEEVHDGDDPKTDDGILQEVARRSRPS